MTGCFRHRQVLLLTALLVSFGLLASRPAYAAEPAKDVGMRSGNHQGFGRVVFDLPKGATVATAVEGDRVLLVFSGADKIGPAGALPRNVLAASTDRSTAILSIAPGSRPRLLRMGDRLVVDVLDPELRASEGGPEARPGMAVAPLPAQAHSLIKNPVATPARERLPLEPRPVGGLKAATAANPGTGTVQPAPAPAPVLAPSEEGRPLGPSLLTRELTPPPSSGAPAIAEMAAPEASGSQPKLPQVQAAPVLPVERAELPTSKPTSGPATAPDKSASLAVVTVPADPSVGAAAFRRGTSAYVVLDRRLNLVAPVGIEGAVVTLGPTVTVLAFPLAPEQALRLGRTQAAWTIERGDPAPGSPMRLESGADGVLFPLASPGRAVTIFDPTTGGTLLVGTTLRSGPETALTGGQRSPGFVILPTWLGVAVEPLSDFADLRTRDRGFSITPATSPMTGTAERPVGQRFEFLDEPTPSLMNRLNAQLASAALAPPRARSAPQLAAAQTMLAMGLDVEAQALLQRAMNEDPQAAADAQLPALAAVAAVLAGRLDEAGALDDARIQDSPDIVLWRGLRDRRLGRDTEAARNLVNGLALVRSYPAAIREQVWPDLAEATVEAGRELAPEETPPYAAALRLERADKVDEALQAWQALADGGDRVASVRATRRLVELQLASGRIEPGAAAEMLERQSLAWRGDATELALRLRAAELRSAAGQWREALDLLRATDPLFPEHRDEIRRRKTAVFETMLSKDGAGLSPLDVILLASDYADCVPDDESGAKLAALLADKLAALDLPARAIPILQGLVKAKAPGAARAQFGVRLGAMMMETGDAAGALTTLDGSAAENLPLSMVEERALLRARAQAALSHQDLAIAALKDVDTARADDLRAALLAKAGDWLGCSAALAALEAKTVPAQGPLDPSMAAVIVREAEAAQHIPDPARLEALRRWLPRMSGAPADILRVLTTTPVTATAELPRARTELALARTLSKRLESLDRP